MAARRSLASRIRETPEGVSIPIRHLEPHQVRCVRRTEPSRTASAIDSPATAPQPHRPHSSGCGSLAIPHILLSAKLPKKAEKFYFLVNQFYVKPNWFHFLVNYFRSASEPVQQKAK